VQSLGIDPVRLIVVDVSWPDNRPSAILGQIDFGPPVWSGNASPPSYGVCEGCWTGLPSYRELSQNQSNTLSFHLSRDLYSGNYSISATFRNLSNGETCSASISQNY
jgi:hypothetical protein